MNIFGSILAAEGPPFVDQISIDVYLGDVFYMICAVAILAGIIGIGLVDSGISRRKNQLDVWLQKIVAAVIGAGSFLIVGFGIWMWQYYEAFGARNAFKEALSDWWLAGTKMTTAAQFFDPAAKGTFNVEVDVFQVFVIFFVTFIMFGVVLLHGAGLERLKASAMYILAAVAGGIVMPVILYLTWGSLSPLTKEGLHDYVGLFSLYIFVGCWALILAWRLGPRLGLFQPHPRTAGPAPSDLSKVGMGVLILLSAIPFIVLGCGFVLPGAGYFGISMTSSSFGLALINVFAAYVGGGIMGMILAYVKKNSYWALLGPLAGYVSGTAMFDITKPWIMLLCSMGGPLVAYATYHAVARLGLDEPKVMPLVLGPGIYAALLPGIVHSGTPTGGFLGFTSGEYAFQGAQITFGWQAIGLGVTLAIALGTGLITILAVEKTIGLRVSEEVELRGLDAHYWGVGVGADPDGIDLSMRSDQTRSAEPGLAPPVAAEGSRPATA